MSSASPIRIALMGAGLFAKEAHLPALLSLQGQFQIAAVYSRTKSTAVQLAEQIPYPVDVTTDVDALLSRDDIEAVDIILPINVMPEMVEKALRAGKHVVGEKPIAPDVAAGRRMIEAWGQQVWMVAEDWRYVETFVRAADAIRNGDIGRPMVCNWALHVVMTRENQYYHTAWRRAGDFPGGFLMDGGVHQMAVLRLLMGEVESVTAFTGQMREDLPPADTLAASLRFASGALGSFTITFAASTETETGLYVVGNQGTLRVHRETLEITRNGQTTSATYTNTSVKDELAAFAAAVRHGEAHRNSPEEALRDVAVIEAILKAAATGSQVTPERVVDTR
jgi:predicted dehydrogenase